MGWQDTDLSALTTEEIQLLFNRVQTEVQQRKEKHAKTVAKQPQVPPTYVTERPKATSLHSSEVDDVSSTDVDDTDNDPDYATSSTSSASKSSEIWDSDLEEEECNDISRQCDKEHRSWSAEGVQSEVEDEEEYEPPPLDPEQCSYQEEPLTSSHRSRLTTQAASKVRYHSKWQTFASCLHKPLFELSRCIESPGSWIISSKEQSGKTVLMAAMAMVSKQLNKPCIIVVNDKKSNVGKVCNDLKGLLGSFDIDVHWMGAAASWDALSQSQLLQRSFATGGLVPVLQCYYTELTRLNMYVREQGSVGLTVVMDECDSIWSTRVEAEQPRFGVYIRREIELYKLLKGTTSPQPLSNASAVRSLVQAIKLYKLLPQVSATHLATMHWHSMWKVPVRHIFVEEHALRDKGYTLETDMQLVATIQAPCKANEYAMRLPEVAQELQVFGSDSRNARLMFFCTCPYVHASNMITTFDIAKEIVHDHVPNAVCVVVHGGGVHAIYKALQSGEQEQDYVTGMGRTMYEDAEASIEIFGKKRSRAKIESQEPKVVKQANIAIQTIDEEMGLQRPVIVLGYNCVGRCVSIRSRHRVINYMIAAYSSGKTSADLKQMMMRGAGFTRQERERQGFQHIRLTSTAEDWQVLQKLYDLQLKALKLSATGNVQDLDKWYHGDYDYEEFRPLFEVKRPHIRRKLGHLDFQQEQRFVDPPLPSKRKKKKSKFINLESSNTKFMQAVYAATAANGNAPVHEKALMQFMRDHPEFLPYAAYSDLHHKAERTHCSKYCHWIKTDAQGLIHVTSKGLVHQADLQAAMDAAADGMGPSHERPSSL